MTRVEYLAALHAARRLEHLTVENIEQIQAVCPHLTVTQIAELLVKNSYFALPPVRVRGAFQVASVYCNGNGSFNFTISYAARTPASYASQDMYPYHGDVFNDYDFMGEAMAYAEANWPEDLVLDDWVDFQNVYLDEPVDPAEYAVGRRTIHLTTNRPWNYMINDRSAPLETLWDASIVHATLDRFEGAELKGGRGGYTNFNCFLCGGGLGLSGCHRCKRRFKDDGYRCGASTPLASKLVALIEATGHKFETHPAA